MTEEKNNKRVKIILFIVVILLILCFWFIAFLLGKNFDTIFPEGNKISNKVVQQNVISSTKKEIIDEESSVINAVSKASNSVVSIVISKNIMKYKTITTNPFGGLFDGFGITRTIPSGESELRTIGGGSGFIVSQDGLVVTNKHVVEDEDALYSVVMNNNKVYDLEILARDTNNDIAVCKIKDLEEKVDYLTLSDSDNIKLGQTVIAIGNALALYQNTVTKGIVSGIGREISAGDSYYGTLETIEDVIQTDAAINSGNSGGPLINLDGEVIGINTAVSTEGQNIGFAISINSVKSIIESVIENGRIVRPYIGIRYVQITELIAKNYDLPYTYGAYISRGAEEEVAVISNSPADKAGLKEGDIILEVDEIKIDSNNNLSKVILNKKIGDTIKIKFYREKIGEKEVEIKLEENLEK